MLLSNATLGPPPLTTPITTQGDDFGEPYQNRSADPLPAGFLHPAWSQFLSGIFQRLSANAAPLEIELVAGAIVLKNGTALITAAGAIALTLGIPLTQSAAGLASSTPAGGDDLKMLRIVSTTAQAHTITTPANGINGNKHIITFAAAVGSFIVLLAYKGVWYAQESSGATLT
jgi:hypothetical protein